MTTITDAVLAEAETLVEKFNQGRIKRTSLSYFLFGVTAPQLPEHVEAAFDHAAEAHRIWLVAESPEGGRDLPPDEDPLRHAEQCRVLLDEALAGLVAAVDAHVAEQSAAHAARQPIKREVA